MRPTNGEISVAPASAHAAACAKLKSNVMLVAMPCAPSRRLRHAFLRLAEGQVRQGSRTRPSWWRVPLFFPSWRPQFWQLVGEVGGRVVQSPALCFGHVP
eukprot:90716-Chlamydomonas_euryale.AAC.1